MEIQQLPSVQNDSQVTQEQSQDISSFPAVVPKNDKLQRFGTSDQFALRFNPDNIGKCAISPVASVMNETSPTIFDLDKGYGSTITTQWIMLFLVDLSEYSGCKGKITTRQLTRLAEALHARFKVMKASELMLFFGCIENGMFGKVAYGQFDPFLVLEMIPKFINYRNQLIDRELDRRKEEEMKRWKREADPTRGIKDIQKIFARFGNPLTPITNEEINEEKESQGVQP